MTTRDGPWTPRSYEDWVASQPEDEHPQLIASIRRRDKRALARRSAIVLADHQTPPEGDWRTWLFLGGRGAGKTFAGARWLIHQAVAGARLALVGPSLHDVREVMIDGPSGLIAQSPSHNPAVYEPSRRRVRWASGAVAHAFSAEDPESLRGPQFDAAWADEFCAWRCPGELIALLRMGLRRGDNPRLVVTTTPKPYPSLRRLMDGGVDLAWIRRTRVHGDGWEALEVPLSEESEAYRCEVLAGDGLTVLRAFDTTTPAQSYAAADVAADFPAGVPSHLTLRVRQMSAIYGLGAPLQRTLLL